MSSILCLSVSLFSALLPGSIQADVRRATPRDAWELLPVRRRCAGGTAGDCFKTFAKGVMQNHLLTPSLSTKERL